MPHDAVVEVLERLLEHSLVRLAETAGEPRFTMLETLREYALECLVERGALEETRQRHAEYSSPRWRRRAYTPNLAPACLCDQWRSYQICAPYSNEV